MTDAPPDRTRLLAVARGEEPPDLVVEGGPGLLRLHPRVARGRRRHRRRAHRRRGRATPAASGWTPAGGTWCRASSTRTCTSSRRCSWPTSSRGSCSRTAPRPWSATRTRWPTCSGVGGVHWLLDATSGLPLDVYVMASSCVPASPFESPRRAFSLDDLASILRRRRALGIAEMMNFPAVIAGDPRELAKLGAGGRRSTSTATRRGSRGRALDAYLATGIATDHEATTAEEALAKRRRGCWVLLREASNARNLRDLLPLVRELRPGLVRVLHRRPRAGHAAARGPHQPDVPRGGRRGRRRPRTSCCMATLNPARCHGLREAGAVAPGYRADLLLLRGPARVPARSRAQVRPGRGRGRARRAVRAPRGPGLGGRAACGPRRSGGRRPALPAGGGGPVRVIGLVPDQLLTGRLVERAGRVRGRRRRPTRAATC